MAVDIKLPEVLAPAGSLEGLYAAVNAGCDAVYIGGSRFGARAYADNPGEDDMIKAIEYCHLHGVKIYMTVNTLLKEMELFNGLYNYIKPYYEAGLDAAIVQDTGVMLMLHKWFPDLELHASTQMTITGVDGAKLLEEEGATRVVTARELHIREVFSVGNQPFKHPLRARLDCDTVNFTVMANFLDCIAINQHSGEQVSRNQQGRGGTDFLPCFRFFGCFVLLNEV